MVNLNVHKGIDVVRHSNTVAAGVTTITPSAGIDMAGWEGCIFVAELGAIVAGAATSVEVHQSSDDGVADAYTALAGSKVTVADTDDNKVAVVTIHRPQERYLKMVVNRATQNATLEGITAILYGPRVLPVTMTAAQVLGNELHVSPAEGTA